MDNNQINYFERQIDILKINFSAQKKSKKGIFI